MNSILHPTVLPEGARFYGVGHYQFNRLSLAEIIGWVMGYLKVKEFLSAEERDMEKRLGDALLIIRGEEGDFVYLTPEEFEILGINYYMRYMGDIRRKLRMGSNMRLKVK